MPLKAGLRLIAVTLFLGVLSCPAAAQAQPACPALDDSGRAKLTTYVQKKYKLPITLPIEIADGGLVNESCYRKLLFHSGMPAGR